MALTRSCSYCARMHCLSLILRLLSQYFDTLAVVGANSLILEHDPQTVANLQSQVRHSFGNGARGFGGKDS